VRRASAVLFLSAALILAFSTLNAGAATKGVEIRDIAYNPKTITVKEGDTVTWTQKDQIGHSVTSTDDLFDSSPGCDATPENDNCLKPNDTFSFTFETAGEFSYHCRVHSSMVGNVVVEAAATTTTSSTTTTTKPTTTSSSTTTSTSDTTTTSSSTTTTTSTTVFSSASGQVAVADKGGSGGGSSNLPLLLGAAAIVAGLAGLAYWLWWRSGEGPYDDGPDWTQEPPPTVQGPRI
jgi:plastocyanin